MTRVAWSTQIVHTEQIPARAAKYSEPAALLSAPVRAALSARGVTRLFTHQAQAIDAARAGLAMPMTASHHCDVMLGNRQW